MKLLHILLLSVFCTITTNKCADIKQEVEATEIYKQWKAEPVGVWARTGIPSHQMPPNDPRNYYHPKSIFGKKSTAILHTCERTDGTKDTMGCMRWKKTGTTTSKKQQKKDEHAKEKLHEKFVTLIGGEDALLQQILDLSLRKRSIRNQIEAVYSDEEFVTSIELKNILVPLALIGELRQRAHNNAISKTEIDEQLTLLTNERTKIEALIPEDIYERIKNDPTLLANINSLLSNQDEKTKLLKQVAQIIEEEPELKELDQLHSQIVTQAWNKFNKRSNFELFHQNALKHKRARILKQEPHRMALIEQNQNACACVTDITITQQELAEFIFDGIYTSLSGNASAELIAILKSLKLHLPENIIPQMPEPIAQRTPINIATFVQDQYPLLENPANADDYIAQAYLFLLQTTLAEKCSKNPTATSEELLLTEEEVKDSLSNTFKMHAKLKAITPDDILKIMEIEHPYLFPAQTVNETSKPIVPSNKSDDEFELSDGEKEILSNEISPDETIETITTVKGSEPLTTFLGRSIGLLW